MTRVLLLTVVCAVSLVRPVASAESPLSRYRDVSLGDPGQVVVDRLKVPLSDVKVVHDRPTVVQQLTWRPHRSVSGATVEPDPLAEMVLTFHLGRLARIAVSYDRARTAGLTDADLNDALTQHVWNIDAPVAADDARSADRIKRARADRELGRR